MRENPQTERETKRQDAAGVVLLITLVILVILATLGYTLSAQVAARRHRAQYIIDYGQARYACGSALKYALTAAQNIEAQAIARPNDPDFSDVFAMSEEEYQKLLADYALLETDTSDNRSAPNRPGDEDANDFNDLGLGDFDRFASPALATVPGPYGPVWPLVSQPVKFELGSAQVTIEIEDENAKYPMSWVLMEDEELKSLAEAGFVTFCEWMGYGRKDIESLRQDLARVGEIRTFQLEFKDTKASNAKTARDRARSRAARSRRAARRTTGRTSSARKTARTPPDPATQQKADFGKLFHSSLINTELLSRPSIVTESRDESAMKYASLWATKTVNINTAPRHVLEAALMFGSVADAPKIAQLIIQQRREQPFENIEGLKGDLLQYSDSIEKCKDFLTTTSTVFTIRVTATSGVATSTALAAVTKEGDKVKRIGIISD